MKPASTINQKTPILPESASLRIAHSTYQQETTGVNISKAHLKQQMLDEVLTIKGPQPHKSFRFYPDGPMGSYSGL